MQFSIPKTYKQPPVAVVRPDFNFVQSHLTCDKETRCMLKLAFLSADIGKRELRK